MEKKKKDNQNSGEGNLWKHERAFLNFRRIIFGMWPFFFLDVSCIKKMDIIGE